MKPILPWMGGKRRLAKFLLPRFPAHSCYVEPFSGGAALLFMRHQPARVEVINDINGELVNLYRVVKHHLEEFVRQFRWALISREMYRWAKLSVPDTLTDIQRAARFFYLQKMAFGGKLVNPTFGTAATAPPRLNLLRIEEILSEAHLRLSRVYIERLDWKACIAKYDRPGTFFYCDPPYWETAGYGSEFPFEHYQAMAKLMSELDGRMMASINDHPDIRQAFEGHRMERVDIEYTVGGSQRKKATELVICNW